MHKYKLIKNCMLIAIAVAFLMIFSFYTSPLTNTLGSDAAFFQLVGQGMKMGMLPYRDFFDMKGPYLFIIENIGQLLAFGRVGIFIVQAVFFYLSLLIINKIYKLALDKNNLGLELILLIPVLLHAAATFQGGNLTEEFSLPALLLCFYFYMRYMVGEDQTKHPPVYALAYGMAFGFMAFIRITNAASIAAIILCILIRLVKNKSIKNILENAVAFVAGLFISSVPVLLWCYFNGILPDMLFQVFAFGYLYAAEGGVVGINFSLWDLLFVLPVVTCAISSKRKLFLLDMIINSAVLYLVISMGNNYLHYYTLLVPLTVLSVYFCVDIYNIYIYIYGKRSHRFGACIILSVICLLPVAYGTAVHTNKFLRGALTDSEFDYDAQNIVQYIPEEERDSVYAYETNPNWYLWAEVYPCIKYCAWQNHYIQLMPQIEQELQEHFMQDDPKWFVFEIKKDMPEFLSVILEEKYEMIAENDSYLLYNLRADD